MFKKILFIILFLFFTAPYSFGKELKARIVIEHFWDHYFLMALEHGSSTTSGTTNYTAVYDGRLQDLKEKNGFNYHNPSFDTQYGVIGSFNASYIKEVNNIIKADGQIVYTTEIMENGKDKRECKFLPSQPNPYPVLWIKFMDKNKAKYRLDLYTPDLTYKYKSITTIFGHTEKVEEDITRNIAHCTNIFLNPPNSVEGDYNTKTNIITGNKKWDLDQRAFGGGYGYTIVSCYIGPELPEVTIEPKDNKVYEEWLPNGGKDSNNLTFIVKSSPEAYIELELFDVSKEKGECLNYPTLDTAEESYDLKFNPAENPDFEVNSLGQKAVSKQKTKLLEIAVKSHDYGSFGKIRAFAVLNKGEPNEVRFPAIFKDKNTASISIPKDDDANHIADAWEKDEGVSGYSPRWDEDSEPAGQKENGDGFSLYEEYRGFYIQNQHKRLIPKKKELFIYDPDGLAKDSYFEKASGLKVHYITQAEMNGVGSSKDMKRCVNFNSGFSTINPQFGLHVIRVNGIPKSPEGLILNGEMIQEEGWPGGPRFARVIKIYPESVSYCINGVYERNINKIKFNLAKCGIKDIENYVKQTIEEITRSTTTHELGHAVGIMHHKNLTTSRFQCLFSTTQGDPACVMRYLWDECRDPKGKKYTINYFLLYLKTPFSRPCIFCKNPDNCFGKIDVCD